MKLTRNERLILTDLFGASNGLYLFTLYRQLALTPKEIFIAIDKLKNAGIIQVDDSRALLTKKGIEHVIMNKTNMNIDIRAKDEDKKQKTFEGPKIEINAFYIPTDFQK